MNKQVLRILEIYIYIYMKFCFSQNTFFPNTYQGIRSIHSPAKVGIGYYKAVNYQPGS